MSSGMPIDPACYTTYGELQSGKKLRWITFGVDNSVIKVYATGDASKRGREAWAEFTSPASMPDNECRYGVFDLDIVMDDGVHERENTKIVFINWADDNSKIKKKMVHAASKDSFRKGLDGVAVDYQAADRDELKYGSMLEMKAAELKIPKVSLEKMLA
ncbi:hypothetical protein KFE25_004835 [Diacronema lutheri]|uniref:ADF-H domain-containing protein n=1 Tax=Diacronema lutheri TaxID=2081491 RepID=A0A8J5XMH0_DIALT|nr:hypothetical protein KFE25_004835 [Diacronema lutheri]